jgi:uncharacterized protein (TIGR02271 family)
MDVVDRSGEKFGKAGEIMPDGQSFNVDTGLFGLGGEYYIPFSAVREVRGKSIVVNVAKDELDQQGWDTPPVERTATRTTGTVSTADTGQTVRLREEELQARKTPVEAGRVQVGKEVVEEQKTLEVPVTREEVTVERHPVARQPSDKPVGESGESIQVPVREEQVSVEKRPVVTEEIEVGKRQVRETQQVSGTVRREEARVEGQGDVDVERKP